MIDEDEEDEPEAASASVHRFEVPGSAAGERLDRFLAGSIAGLTRSQIQRHLGAGRASVDGEVERRAGRALSPGERVELVVPPPAPSYLVPEDLPFSVIHEDDEIVVVDKPAGLAVHPGAGRPSGTLVNALLHRIPRFGAVFGSIRPGIVHRLDMDTSGVMVVAKTEAAFAALVAAFAARRVIKRYLAVCQGEPDGPGVLDRPIGRSPHDRRRFTTRTRSGKPALTRYTVRERFGGAALLDVDIETGRTHQIRVHLSEAGLPLIGDPVYGRRPPKSLAVGDFARPALHARELTFPHPADGRPRAFSAPIPLDLERLLERLRRSS